MKDGTGVNQFVNLQRNVYKELYRFLTEKKIRIKNVAANSNFGDADGDDDDEVNDPYMERMKREREQVLRPTQSLLWLLPHTPNAASCAALPDSLLSRSSSHRRIWPRMTTTTTRTRFGPPADHACTANPAAFCTCGWLWLLGCLATMSASACGTVLCIRFDRVDIRSLRSPMTILRRGLSRTLTKSLTRVTLTTMRELRRRRPRKVVMMKPPRTPRTTRMRRSRGR